MARYNRSRSYRGHSNRSSSFTRHSHRGYSNNRNARYRRSNNGGFYSKGKALSLFAREHMAPDIFGELKNTGPMGQAIGFCGNKLIRKPLHEVCFDIVGMIYKKGKDDPIIGCLLYFVVSILATSLLAAIVGLLVR